MIKIEAIVREEALEDVKAALIAEDARLPTRPKFASTVAAP